MIVDNSESKFVDVAFFDKFQKKMQHSPQEML